MWAVVAPALGLLLLVGGLGLVAWALAHPAEGYPDEETTPLV